MFNGRYQSYVWTYTLFPVYYAFVLKLVAKYCI